jgi:molybdopterin molybdotransferase
MVSVEEASRIIFSTCFRPKVESVPFDKAVGRILATPIKADRPFPPFDRVAMDGIAISFDTFERGARAFSIEGTQAAGQPGKKLIDTGNCIEVMTGAVLPGGTDTVIRYEDINIDERVATIKADVAKGQNVHRCGADAVQDEVLLQPGVLLSPAEVALLASVGRETIDVYAYPSAAVISTGDELVEVGSNPQPHQIRRSNVFAIEAAMVKLGWPAQVFHFTDEKDALHRALSDIHDRFEVIILSGGVSKGKFDFVPQILERIGVKKLFHQVNQKPGKPFWFGASDGKTVFALPGNPVSTFMCFYRYIKPWLLRSFGQEVVQPQVVLSSDIIVKPAMTLFVQVNVTNNHGTLLATPLPGGGSGDFANLKEVTGFVELPEGRTEFRKGEVCFYIPFRP